MIRAKTKLKVADNTGAKLIEVIRILGGGRPSVAKVGDVFVASVKVAMPNGNIKKKEVIKAVMVRQKKPYQRPDGTVVRFDENAAVIVEGKEPRGTRIFGPVMKELKNLGYNKIVSLAEEVL